MMVLYGTFYNTYERGFLGNVPKKKTQGNLNSIMLVNLCFFFVTNFTNFSVLPYKVLYLSLITSSWVTNRGP